MIHSPSLEFARSPSSSASPASPRAPADKGAAAAAGVASPRFADLLDRSEPGQASVFDSADEASVIEPDGKELPLAAGNLLPDHEERAEPNELVDTQGLDPAVGMVPPDLTNADISLRSTPGAPGALADPRLIGPPAGSFAVSTPATDAQSAADGQGGQALPNSLESADALDSAVSASLRAAASVKSGAVTAPTTAPALAASAQQSGQMAAGTDPVAPDPSTDPAVATVELLRSKVASAAPKASGEESSGASAASAMQADRHQLRSAARNMTLTAAIRQEMRAASPLGAGLIERPSPGSEFALAAPQLPASAAPAGAGQAALPTFQSLHIATMIDRLVEARQAAAGGTMKFSIAHGEFGPVGIRFEHLAAAGLAGVALTSSDPGFAPAVHAALAERSQSERQPGAGDQSRSEQAAARSEASAQGGQPQSQHARSQGEKSRSTSSFERAPGSDDSSGAPSAADSRRAGPRGLYA